MRLLSAMFKALCVLVAMALVGGGMIGILILLNYFGISIDMVMGANVLFLFGMLTWLFYHDHSKCKAKTDG